MPAYPPASPTEPLAADVPRPAAYAPVIWMTIGGLMLFGSFLLGMAVKGGREPLRGQVNSSSGDAIVEAVQRVGPAVMNVDTKFGPASANSEFLTIPGLSDKPQMGKGTGVIFDSARGLMLTNAHVVTNPQSGANAKTIQVTTREGKKYKGSVLGADKESDIAVVQLETKTLPAARLATFKDEKELPIGQWAIAIGNPFAQANTVTVGVISATERTIPVPDPRRPGKSRNLTGMIQTDAAINPGNSGGPLCNINGEVIGINTAIYGIGTGLGFAIPINKARDVALQLVAEGKVRRPFAGLRVVSVTSSIKTNLGLPDGDGALIKTITPGSPAAKADLKLGDVIRTMDGKPMKTEKDITDYVKSKKVGDTVVIEYLRNGSVKKSARVKLVDRPDDE